MSRLPGFRLGRPRPWRGVTLFVFVFAGALFVTSGLNSHGLDLRAASVSDLDTVVRQEAARSSSLQRQVADLNAEVTRLTASVDAADVARLQRRVDRLKGPAGFEPASGAGVRVTLDDAPKSMITKAREGELGSVTEDELVVHQQDIQAVINALWAGGAEAITLQGKRIISTSGVKCVGNTVILQGVPYAPPYRIAAIGDPDKLQAALDSSSYVVAYLTFVRDFGLGWRVSAESSLELPPYEGSTTLRYAVPATPRTASGHASSAAD